MPDLNFAVAGAEVPTFAATPMLIFKLRITNANEQERIHSVTLRSQVQIAATRRRYNADEQARLNDVFGEPQRWGETLRSQLWTHTNAVVPPFTGTSVVDLPVPCTYDFEVVSTKYFNALEGGDIPLSFLFSGTTFYEGVTGQLQVGQISWSKEASYRLPVALWREAIESSFPNSAWIRLPKDVFDQLYQYKIERGLPTWEAAFTRLLRASGAEVQS